ncbi:hypothetical protein [Streptomyces sp. NBC_00328]|uniref:hypothetical protein n=1 Tax=Streptomyces sp. NBC_00328 TaxID=2903646 RepID=UPI002E2E0E32|nr:hypothetical protein [Streptomyces sp. NBC_00328]
MTGTARRVTRPGERHRATAARPGERHRAAGDPCGWAALRCGGPLGIVRFTLLKLVTIVIAIAVGLVLGAVLAQPAVTSPSAEGG